MKLWPEQYVNKKVQEHETKIAALEAKLAELTKPKPKRTTKKKVIQKPA